MTQLSSIDNNKVKNTKTGKAEKKEKEGQMLWAYPPTRRQMAATAAGVAVGVTMIAVGAYLSFANIAPQQARTKARSDFVKQRLRKFLDD
ncbi:uncharacterized protein LOC110730022 [Chenopodium quinoa]|uniref:uncharacterized protein LOC110730022 n=1 Tax=Chenopodium quinoa TaxID=63459 RepID=UPI000B78D74E|nr:uncharacterized protein LOC110730022 [Chenopodium quinoa]